MENTGVALGTNGKRKENTNVSWELNANTKKTQVLRRNLWKTQAKIMVLRWKQNNSMKTYVLHKNIKNTLKKHRCCVGTYGKRKENTCCT